MAELLINASAFTICHDALNALADRLEAATYTLDLSEDTSQTGEKELECFEALIKLKDILAALARETANDVKKTQEGYKAADR